MGECITVESQNPSSAKPVPIPLHESPHAPLFFVLLLSALACSEEPVPPAHDVEPLEGGKSS